MSQYRSPFTDEFDAQIRALIRNEIERINAAPTCTCLGEVLAEDMTCPIHGAYLRGESAEKADCKWD